MPVKSTFPSSLFETTELEDRARRIACRWVGDAANDTEALLRIRSAIFELGSLISPITGFPTSDAATPDHLNGRPLIWMEAESAFWCSGERYSLGRLIRHLSSWVDLGFVGFDCHDASGAMALFAASIGIELRIRKITLLRPFSTRPIHVLGWTMNDANPSMVCRWQRHQVCVAPRTGTIFDPLVMFDEEIDRSSGLTSIQLSPRAYSWSEYRRRLAHPLFLVDHHDHQEFVDVEPFRGVSSEMAGLVHPGFVDSGFLSGGTQGEAYAASLGALWQSKRDLYRDNFEALVTGIYRGCMPRFARVGEHVYVRLIRRSDGQGGLPGGAGIQRRVKVIRGDYVLELLGSKDADLDGVHEQLIPLTL